MTSCCGNEVVFNSALGEVVSSNIAYLTNLLCSGNNFTLISLFLIIVSAILYVLTRSIGAKYSFYPTPLRK